jgi:hypothetical protein
MQVEKELMVLFMLQMEVGVEDLLQLEVMQVLMDLMKKVEQVEQEQIQLQSLDQVYLIQEFMQVEEEVEVIIAEHHHLLVEQEELEEVEQEIL